MSKAYGNVLESGRARLEDAMNKVDCFMIDRKLVETLERAVADYKQAVAILEEEEAKRAARWAAIKADWAAIEADSANA
jgi:hypothetical protein